MIVEAFIQQSFRKSFFKVHEYRQNDPSISPQRRRRAVIDLKIDAIY